MYNARKIEWRSGVSAKIPAEDCYNELERIRSDNGGDLTAEIVVDAARPQGAVLHPQIFDKGMKAAAEEYYKDRARQTLGGLLVIYTEDVAGETDRLEVRLYSGVEHRLTDSGRVAQIYSSTEEALQHSARREFVLAEALGAVVAWRKKYAALSELATIFQAIDGIAV